MKEVVQVGQYRVLQQIGIGSFSRVFKAMKLNTNKYVAIKKIPKNTSQNLVINYNQFNQLVRKQIQILKQLNHPNIIKLIQQMQSKKNKYLVFEYCINGNLEQYIQKYYNGKMPQSLVQKIASQIAEALQLLSFKKFVHRDLKLSNILLDQNFLIKIADFGFAKHYSNQIQLMSTFCGTPLTMAPQILQRNNYNQKCDIWSFGVIIYQLIAGKPPFIPHNGGLIQLLQIILKQKPKFDPKLFSQSLINLLKQMLEINPDKRISINQMKKHSWLKANGQIKPQEIQQILKSVKIEQQKQQFVDSWNDQQYNQIRKYIVIHLRNLIKMHIQCMIKQVDKLTDLKKLQKLPFHEAKILGKYLPIFNKYYKQKIKNQIVIINFFGNFYSINLKDLYQEELQSYQQSYMYQQYWKNLLLLAEQIICSEFHNKHHSEIIQQYQQILQLLILMQPQNIIKKIRIKISFLQHYKSNHPFTEENTKILKRLQSINIKQFIMDKQNQQEQVWPTIMQELFFKTELKQNQQLQFPNNQDVLILNNMIQNRKQSL